MKQFEVGKKYGAMDTAVPPITILKRTPKTCMVANDEGLQWRMKIKEMDGTEYMTDSGVPAEWQDCYTYYAKNEEE